jgi:hypothetical protein
VRKLVACPFCREMFEKGEAAACPACGLALTDLDKLPPSHDALAEADDFGIPRQPHLEPLPRWYMGRGKGLLIAASLLGLAAFFMPWIDMTAPEIRVLSGADLARGRIGWIWSAAVAWFVLLPMVASRPSIDKMRGARVAAAFLSAIPVVSTSILYLMPPHSRYVPLRYQFGFGFFATWVIGVVSILVSVRFGGKIDDIAVTRGRVAGSGEPLH